MDSVDDRQLAEVLGNLAIEMQAQRENYALLQNIAAAAVFIVPGTSWAGVARVEGRRVEPAVPTDEVAAALDRLQTELGEGPAVSALRDHHTVFITDLTEETRWPEFVPEAIRIGVHCVLAYRLFTTGETFGALSLYGATPGALDDDSAAIGEVLAQHAAVAMAGAAAEEHLYKAAASRDVIGQAKGILMHRDKLTGLQAFAALTRASQETNVKLVNVARWLVEDHESNLEGTSTD